jgi:hypothetical protein
MSQIGFRLSLKCWSDRMWIRTFASPWSRLCWNLTYMRQEDPDLSFVTALKAGQDQALNALKDRHREGLFRFVLRSMLLLMLAQS